MSELLWKPTEYFLHELSFLSKKKLSPEVRPSKYFISSFIGICFQCENFSYINEALSEIQIDEHVKQETEITPKTDSGRGEDDETSSTSSQSWQIEDAEGDDDEILDDYDKRFLKLSQSMQQLEKQFQSDIRPFLKDQPMN